MIANIIKAGTVAEFQDGSKKKLVLDGHEIMVARVGNNYYAVANKCPHMGGDLSMGKLEGTVITCPRHGSQFDITDGKVIRWTRWEGVLYTVNKAIISPHPVKTYKVKVEEGLIFVEV